MGAARCDGDLFSRSVTAGPEVGLITTRVLDDSLTVGGESGCEEEWHGHSDHSVLHVCVAFATATQIAMRLLVRFGDILFDKV